jgi:hypothetical protein
MLSMSRGDALPKSCLVSGAGDERGEGKAEPRKLLCRCLSGVASRLVQEMRGRS